MPNDILYSLGAIPNPPDSRDFLLANYLPARVALPTKFSLRDKMSPVKSQQTLGSCTAFGFSAMVEYYNMLEFNRILDLSEQWLYTETKRIDGFAGEGSYPRAVCQALLSVGECEEAFFPYESRYPALNSPKPGATDNALTYRIQSYATVATDLESIKQAIYLNGPVALSLKVYDNFMTTGSSGLVSYPAGNLRGGHLVCACGFDGDKIEIKNSWSPNWADHGYCWIPETVWNAIRMDAMSLVDLTNIALPWKDWPSEEISSGFRVKSSGLMLGYPSGNFFPYIELTKRQVYLIGTRWGKTLDKSLEEDYTLATRGFVRDSIPGLNWNTAEWGSLITRYQMALLISRSL